MKRSHIPSLVIVLILAIIVISCGDDSQEPIRGRNLTETATGLEFKQYVEQHKGAIEKLLVANGYSLDTSWAQKDGVAPNWIDTVVFEFQDDANVAWLYGNVTIQGRRKPNGKDYVLPVYFSFHFKKLDDQWKLALRNGYFVGMLDDEETDNSDIPPEVFAGINRIFPANFTANK